MRLLVLGGTGMLGHRLWLHASHEHEVWATVRTSPEVVPDWPEFDRSRVLDHVDALNFEDVAGALARVRPDVIINCIGLIKQSPLAQSPLLTLQMNAVLPHRLALLCQVSSIRLVHISTDCVFSGQKGNYLESDPSDAADLYGRTKYLGEVIYPHTLTLRTSIIGRELKTRFGLIEWFLSQTGIIKGFTRAIYSGLTTDELARIILRYVLKNADLHGLYHISSMPITKCDLLSLAKEAFNHVVAIEPDATFQCDRSLNSNRFRTRTGYTPPTWPEMIRELASTSARY